MMVGDSGCGQSSLLRVSEGKMPATNASFLHLKIMSFTLYAPRLLFRQRRALDSMICKVLSPLFENPFIPFSGAICPFSGRHK